MDDGADIPREMVAGIYERIQQRELRSNEDHVTYVSRVEQSILGLKTVSAVPSPVTHSWAYLCELSYIIWLPSVLCTIYHLFNLASADSRRAAQTSGVLLSSVRGAGRQQAS